MRHLTIIATCLVLLGCSTSAPVGQGPLVIHTPAGWLLEHDTPGGLDFYHLWTSSGKDGLLMFSKWPPPSRPEDIPELVRKVADGFVQQAKKSAEFTLVDEKYEFDQFAGDHCRGSYATFRVKSADTKAVQAMFMMSVGGEVWNGQFTGTAEQWKQAVRLLTTIKTKG